MALPPNPLEAFVWGAGGSKKTPEQVAREKEIAQSLLSKAGDTSPVGHWSQGAARVANALAGKIREGRAERTENRNREEATKAFSGLLSGGFPSADTSTETTFAPTPEGPQATSFAEKVDYPSQRVAGAHGDTDAIRSGIVETASALGVDPVDLATAISYETAGTFDPTKAGPTTKWGRHKGLIQFGEPQAQQYGVNWEDPIGSQLGAEGAVAKYLRDTGVQPGMGLLDIYSAINAGKVGRYDRSDEAAGGAPGTVRDKVEQQMAGHRAKALALIGEPQQADASRPPWPIQNAPQGAEHFGVPGPSQPLPDSERAAIADQTQANMAQVGAPYAPDAAASMGAQPIAAPVAGQLPAATAAPENVHPQQRVAQAMMGSQGRQQGPSMQQLMEVANNPWLSEGQRSVVNALLQQHMQQADPMRRLEMERAQLELEQLRNPQTEYGFIELPDGRVVRTNPRTGEIEEAFQGEPKQPDLPSEVREYNFYADQEAQAGRQPLSFNDWRLQSRKAGATTVNVGGEPGDSALRKKLDEKTGELWSSYQETGATSAATAQDMQVLDELIKIAPQGPVTGRLAEMFPGFSSAGDAFQSIVKRIAPTLRAPGSGATSDIEYDGMLRSLPALRNKPEANEMIATILKAKSAINMDRSSVVDAYARGDITAGEARTRIAEIDKRSIMTPEMRKSLEVMSGEKLPSGGDSADHVPEGIDPTDWEFMTPEERALFQ